MLNGNLGYMSFTNCDQLHVHGPVDLDFETSQLPITQVWYSLDLLPPSAVQQSSAGSSRYVAWLYHLLILQL